MAERMGHGGFESREYRGSGGRRRTYGRIASGHGGRRLPRSGSSMLAKMGICAMLLALVPVINMINSGSIEVSAAPNETDGEEYLGKLRFVELPGIIEVFASDSKLDLGLNCTVCELDGYEAVLGGVAGQMVCAPSAGRIKSAAGDSIELALDGDVVVAISGMQSILVEEGQPIRHRDTLGRAEEGMGVAVYRAGKPEYPHEYIRLPAVGGE